MRTEQNKAITDHLVSELDKGNTAVFDEVADPKCVDHAVPPGMSPTIESSKQFLVMFHAAFPDLTSSVEFTIAEGDEVMQRVTSHGTMKGDFLGMKATGKSATWTESHIVRIVNGKVVEHWANVDQVGMLQQLGLIPGA